MFPYRDENETQRTPVVTFIIIAVNVLAWVLVEGAGAPLRVAEAVCNLGLIPGELTLSVPPGTRMEMGRGLVCLTDPGRQAFNLLTSMFLHGSWMHLLGNMWFFWLFGNNIEDSMGRGRFVVFYFLCGLFAAFYGAAKSFAAKAGFPSSESGDRPFRLELRKGLRWPSMLPV